MARRIAAPNRLQDVYADRSSQSGLPDCLVHGACTVAMNIVRLPWAVVRRGTVAAVLIHGSIPDVNRVAFAPSLKILFQCLDQLFDIPFTTGSDIFLELKPLET